MAYEKTWQFMSNSEFTPASAIDNARRTLWSLKAFLKGELGGATGAGVLWTHFGSSDGTNLSECGAAGADRWTNSYNGALLVRAAAGSAHSWIVLKSPTMGGQNYYLIIDYAHASSDQNCSIYWSKAVPSVGTLLARPTATDEWSNGRTNGTTVISDGSTAVHRLMAGINENGGFYFATQRNAIGFQHFGVLADVLSEPNAGDTYSLYTYVNYSATTPGCFAIGQLTQGNTGATIGTGTMRLVDGTAVYAAGMLGYFLTYNAATTATIPNATTTDLGKDEVTGKYLDLPINIMHAMLTSGTGGALYGWRGRLPDFALGNEAGQGATFPLTGTPDHFLSGGLWLPGDTAPIL